MSQDHSNLGYYNTYYGDPTYTNNTHHASRSRNEQPTYASTHTWSQMPIGFGSIPVTEAQWRMQQQCQWPTNEAWYGQDILSPSDMTSETSGNESNIPPGLNMACSRSESAEYSDTWEQEPPTAPFSSPIQPLEVSNDLLSNIGSSFTTEGTMVQPLQLASCVTGTPDEAIQQFEYMLDNQTAKGSMPLCASPDVPVYQMIQHQHQHQYQQDHVDADPDVIVQHRRCSSSIHPPTVQQKKPRQTKAAAGSSIKPAKENTTKPRLFCEACRDSKDYTRGFRGEHELARHWAQKHSNCREAWICVDLTPDQKLRNCERCKIGHTYGTSYGGAEHFRRKHTKIFGEDMVEWLRGKNKRRALSGGRLIEEGWLRRVVVDGEGEPSQEQQELSETQNVLTSNEGLESVSETGGRMTVHLQPSFRHAQPQPQPQPQNMHGGGTQAWVQMQFQQYHQGQLQHQSLHDKQHQQSSWYPGMY